MKKQFFSVCAAALLLFSACSKDDDKNVSEMSISEMNSMIIGSWNFDHEEWWESDGSHGIDYEGGNERLTFNSDGSYTELDNNNRETGTYWITNKKELIMREEDGYYSYNDTLIIESLTKTDLIMLWEDYYGDSWDKGRWYYKKIN